MKSDKAKKELNLRLFEPRDKFRVRRKQIIETYTSYGTRAVLFNETTKFRELVEIDGFETKTLVVSDKSLTSAVDKIFELSVTDNFVDMVKRTKHLGNC